MNTHQVTFSLQKPSVSNIKNLFLKIPNESSYLQRLTSGQLIVTYNRKTETAEYYKKPFFSMSKLGNDQLDYYLVDTYPSLQVVSKCEFNSNVHKELPVEIRYTNIQIRKGSELIVTETLAKRNTPEETFANLLHTLTSNILQAIANQAYQHFENFTSELAKKFSNEFTKSGFSIATSTVAKLASDQGSTVYKQIEFGRVEVKVQPLDFTSFVNIHFDAFLFPDETMTSSIASELTYKNREELKEFLVSLAKAFIRTKINYNTLSKNQDDYVRRGLVTYWNSRLRELGKGWQVGESKLYFPDKVPAEFKRESLQIQVVLKNAEIPLTNTVILYLEDAQRFQNSGVPNIELWIHEKLKKVSQQVLANVTYAELVSKFEDYRKIIKSQLDQEVKLIGYKVDYLVTSELISSSQLQFNFNFTESEQVFDARNDKITLKVWVSGRISSINHPTWKKILTPQTDLVTEIKKEVIRLIGQKILNTEADNFYSRLNTEIPGDLKNAVSELLRDKFNVEQDVYIQIIIEQSELKRRFEELATGSHVAEVSLMNGAAVFRVKFSISGVDQWELFATRKYINTDDEKMNIIEDVKEGFEQRLNKIIEAKLLPHTALVNLLSKIENQVVEDVKKIRFLTVSIESIIEAKNTIKEVIKKGDVENITNDYLSWQNQQRKLKQEIQRAIESESSVDAIKKLKEELSDVERNLKGDFGNSAEDLLKLLE